MALKQYGDRVKSIFYATLPRRYRKGGIASRIARFLSRRSQARSAFHHASRLPPLSGAYSFRDAAELVIGAEVMLTVAEPHCLGASLSQT